MRRWAAVALGAVLAAGCSAAPAIVAPTPGFTQVPSTQQGIAVTFAGASLRIPVGWRAMPQTVLSSFSSLEVVLGPETIVDPCVHGSNPNPCSIWWTATLGPNETLVAIWHMGGPPGVPLDATTGEAVIVAGRPGRMRTIAPDDTCRGIGGDEELRVIVPSQAIWNWEQLDACLRGPDHAANEATVHALITDLPPGASQEPMPTDATIPNDSGYVQAPGRLRLTDVTLSFPERWQAVREPVWTMDRSAIATLGPGPIPTCTNWATCGLWPDMRLPDGGMIVAAWNRSNGDFTLDVAPGVPLMLGRHPAKLATMAADTACARIGGEEVMTAAITGEAGDVILQEIDACLRGPDLATNEALFRRILASARTTPKWTPDESPPPSP